MDVWWCGCEWCAWWCGREFVCVVCMGGVTDQRSSLKDYIHRLLACDASLSSSPFCLSLPSDPSVAWEQDTTTIPLTYTNISPQQKCTKHCFVSCSCLDAAARTDGLLCQLGSCSCLDAAAHTDGLLCQLGLCSCLDVAARTDGLLCQLGSSSI